MDEAVRRGDLERVRELTRKGADASAPQRFTRGGGTVLQLAIERGFEDIALALLEAGADVHTKDEQGRTALHWACYKGFKEVGEMLINKGSKVDERDMFGQTPLMTQRQVNEISICLLRAGASCKGLHQGRMYELFDQACREGDVLVVHALIQDGCWASILSREQQERLLLKPAVRAMRLLFMLLSKMVAGSAFYPKRSKNGFSVLPAMTVMCLLFTFLSRMVAGSAIYPERSKKGFSIKPAVRVMCLLFMLLSKMVGGSAFFPESSKKGFSIKPAVRVMCFL